MLLAWMNGLFLQGLIFLLFYALPSLVDCLETSPEGATPMGDVLGNHGGLLSRQWQSRAAELLSVPAGCGCTSFCPPSCPSQSGDTRDRREWV